MLYNIAGLWLYFDGRNNYFEERSAGFLRDSSEKKPEDCDIRISLNLYDHVSKPEGVEVFGGEEALILRKNSPDKGYYLYASDFIMANGQRKKPSLLDTNPEWTDIKMSYVANDEIFSEEDYTRIPWNDYSSFQSMGTAFRYMLLRRNGIQIHSASIDYKGKGFIFSAPSGTGKSTHVHLWRDLYKDEVTIINEDRPVIRFIDDAPMICGTPWSGSSKNFSNKNVPLSSIVMLEQSPVNKIEQLSGDKILQYLMPRCFLTYFDTELMAEGLGTLERLVKDVPVYLLKCRPDFEAVELVQKCLM